MILLTQSKRRVLGATIRPVGFIVWYVREKDSGTVRVSTCRVCSMCLTKFGANVHLSEVDMLVLRVSDLNA